MRRDEYKDIEKIRELYEPINLIFGRITEEDKEDQHVVNHRVRYRPPEIRQSDADKNTTLLLRFFMEEFVKGSDYERTDEEKKTKPFSKGQTHYSQKMKQMHPENPNHKQEEPIFQIFTDVNEPIEYNLDSVDRLTTDVKNASKLYKTRKGKKGGLCESYQ